MRITERQLRRIVRQEILRENNEKEYPDVDAAIAALEAALTSKSTQVGKAMTDPGEIAAFISALFNKIEEKFPSLKGRLVKGLTMATAAEKKEQSSSAK
jgi:hypothetical protein